MKKILQIAVVLLLLGCTSCTFNAHPIISPFNAIYTSFGYGLDTSLHFADTFSIAENKPLHVGDYLAWWDADGQIVAPAEAYAHYQKGRFKRWRARRFSQVHNAKKEYWFLLLFNNPSNKFQSATFLSYFLSSGNLTAFKVDSNGIWQTVGLASTHLHPAKNSSGLMNFNHDLNLSPKENQMLLLRFQKTIDRNIQISFSVRKIDALTYEAHNNLNEKVAFALGFVSFALVLMALLFAFLKDKIYLLQAGYIFFSIWVIEDKNKNFFEQLPNWLFELQSHLPELSISLCVCAFITPIVRFILQPKNFSESTDKFLLWLQKVNYALIIYALFQFFVYLFYQASISDTILKFFSYPIITFNLVYFWIILLVAIKSFLVVSFKQKIFAASVAVAMMLWYIQIMNNLGITNSTFILHNNIFLSIIIETGVYLYFIIDRFVSERKEKITLLESKLALQKQITTSVVEAQENERKRVAQELHDGLGGYLSSLRLLVNRNKTENKTQNELLQTIEEKLDHAIHDVREISHNLMPTDFASKDFTTILKEHLTILNDNGNIRFEFFFDEKLNSIEKSIQISLYRITSELIRNIQTHSGATVATIQLIAHANQIVLNAEDNGVGFNSNNQHSGIGLKNTQSRVDFLHGKLNIDSNKLGTTIIIEIPINYETAQTHFN